MNDADFEQNMGFREFFLGIKKRYDMQSRAQKFRMKQKQEIAQLKKAFQERSVEDMTSQISEVVGQKRESSADANHISQLQQMQEKIQKLEQQIEEKNRQMQELQAQNGPAHSTGIDTNALAPSTLYSRQNTKASSTEIHNNEDKTANAAPKPSALGPIMDE